MLKHGDLTEEIIGVFYEVYNELGYGFLEAVYENSMAVALHQANLPHHAQRPLRVRFRGEVVGEYKADIIADENVLLELKASTTIQSKHVAQTLNYLKATKIEVGLILNFGPKPEFKRLFFDQ